MLKRILSSLPPTMQLTDLDHALASGNPYGLTPAECAIMRVLYREAPSVTAAARVLDASTNDVNCLLRSATRKLSRSFPDYPSNTLQDRRVWSLWGDLEAEAKKGRRSLVGARIPALFLPPSVKEPTRATI